MSALGAMGLLLRQVRSEHGIIVLTALVIAVTSFLLAGAPRVFNRMSDEALQHALQAVPAPRRDITLGQNGSIAPGGDGGLASIRSRGARFESDFPASLGAVISERHTRVSLSRFRVIEPPSYDTRISLRYQDGLVEATTLAAGRWPVDRGMALQPLEYAEQPPESQEPAIIEVAVSVATAAEIGVGVGDRLAIQLDSAGLVIRGGFYRIGEAAVEVVGLFEPIDSEAEDWSGDSDLLAGSVGGSDFHPIAFATAYVSADQYRSLWTSQLPFRYEWRYRVDPEILDGSQVDQLQLDLRRIERTLTASVGSANAVTITTGLPRILDRYAGERDLSESVLSVAAIGPFGLAGGAIAMLAILAVRRRTSSLGLARSRGASGAIVLGSQLWLGALVAGSAAIAGLVLATTVIGARDSGLSPILATAVGSIAVALLGVATWSVTRRPLAAVDREDAPVLRVSPRRLVFEVTVVGIAVVATLLLQQRGLLIDEATGVIRFDPLLASVPLLGGLAAAIVVIRLYPLPVRGLGWLAARRRDIVPVLGLRRIGRQPAVASLTVLVVMLTVAFGAFAAVVSSSLRHGQEVASYLEVGADYRLERVGIGALGPSFDPSTVAGGEAVGAGVDVPAARFSSTPRQRVPIFLGAIDPVGYDAVTDGTAADLDWPRAFLAQPGGAAGTAERPIPAILSERVPTATAVLDPGATFRVTVAGEELVLVVVERRAGFPGVDSQRPFVIIPLDWLRAATGELWPPSVLWLRASPDAAAGLAEAIAGQPGGIRTFSRYEVLAATAEAPFGRLVVLGYWLAVVIAAAYMVLTVMGATVLSAERRTRDIAYLRPMGFSTRQALGLAFAEHAPALLLALVPGIALGIAVAILCLPGLGLAAFVGPGADVSLFVEAAVLVLLGGAMVVAMALAVVGGTWLSGRVRLTDALRYGEN
ncbi:MAG: hypothetical protein FIA92_08875 [Chloroflexi bacterium]|nr:hypothetical protein [Chloroflexota bacterium]